MRLIDAEKVTEVDCSGLEGYVKPEHYEIVASFFFEKFINCQPTAYDVDKVVEEIEIDRQVDFNYHIRTDYRSLINDIYDKTVQKVRKGGVNG